MSQSEIQYFMQTLADLHEKFKLKEYKITPLDQHATINIVEQLYTKLITTSVEAPKLESKVIPQPKVVEQMQPTLEVENNSIQSAKEEINKEINEVFQTTPEEPKVVYGKPNNDFQLGINEKIMFAKELFNDDVNALTESIRQLKSFENAESAYQFFDDRLSPFLLDEGKVEEIIEEYRNVIERIYNY